MIDSLIAQTLTAAPIGGAAPLDFLDELGKLVLGVVAAVLALVVQEVRVRLQRAATARAKAIARAMAEGVESLQPEVAAPAKRSIKEASQRRNVAEAVDRVVQETVNGGIHPQPPAVRGAEDRGEFPPGAPISPSGGAALLLAVALTVAAVLAALLGTAGCVKPAVHQTAKDLRRHVSDYRSRVTEPQGETLTAQLGDRIEAEVAAIEEATR